ncbi:MAG: HYC_CC_PP family protein [Daejeonella sp.]|uniref:HYC_CC_PP family protein n=1 Tax=Daejeonella sp. JGW-45 TaxID=3034148 RepID=UPI0023ED4A5D|nr:hypothetical protein [Daejeonella sp. JGW-45]
MKNLIVTILAVFYLGVSSGASVYVHYCMGKVVESGFVSKEGKACNECGMKADKPGDCCKHDSKELKIDSAQKTSSNSFDFSVFGTDLPSNRNSGIPQIFTTALIEEQPVSNSPPRTDSTPVFIRNCIFRI